MPLALAVPQKIDAHSCIYLLRNRSNESDERRRLSMSIFHCSIKIISRSAGRSATSSSAYRSGTKLHDQETGDLYDYSRKHGVLHAEVLLCENAPAAYADREVLWNAVQKSRARRTRSWHAKLKSPSQKRFQRRTGSQSFGSTCRRTSSRRACVRILRCTTKEMAIRTRTFS